MNLILFLIGLTILNICVLCSINWKDKNWWSLNREYEFKIWTREDLLKFTPYEFELWCGDLMKKLGYRVINTPQTKDEGKDVVVIKDGVKTYIECKQFDDSLVGRPLLQKLVGAAYADNVESVLFITTSLFTQDACNWMCKINMNTKMNFEIWDCDDLLKMANKAFANNYKEDFDDTMVLDLSCIKGGN